MNQLRILILMSYFNRPKLVRNALQSVLFANEHHQNWELAFGDDGSDIPGAPIVEEVLRDHMDKVRLVRNDMTLEDKLEHGIVLGRLANAEIERSEADIGIMLCDDDILHPLYLMNLSEFFTNRSEVLYCWSYVSLFNPLLGAPQTGAGPLPAWNRYNLHGDEIDPVGNVDASQVAWRLECCKKYGAWFPDSTKADDGRPWLNDTDKGFFAGLRDRCGRCHKTGFVSQHKGVHDFQLLWHKNAGREALASYVGSIQEKAGELF